MDMLPHSRAVADAPYGRQPDAESLLSYLVDQGHLRPEHAERIVAYRRFYFQDKRDISGPQLTRVRGTVTGVHRPSWLGSLPYQETDLCNLQGFRAHRRCLQENHRPLVEFLEALFTYPRNDKAFFLSWSREQQQRGIQALTLLGDLLQGMERSLG